jgi:mannitol/fructose-specific phosphotransferase system IIA component (Ntr-type)
MLEKQKKQAEWTTQHELTKEQFKQLILNKITRAKQYHRAVSKREELYGAR